MSEAQSKLSIWNKYFYEIHMFPFIIKYKKTLSSVYKAVENEAILKYFEQRFKSGGVDYTSIERNTVLTFKNELFAIRPNLNFNKWTGISGGQIMITQEQNKRTVTYEFNTSRFFIIGAIAGLIFGLTSKMLLAGVFGFSFLGLLNWLISIIHHRLYFSSLLNKALCAK